MSTDQLVVTALAFLLLEQSFQRTQQFLRRGSLVRDQQFHPGELFEVLNIGAAAPAFKQNSHLVARLIMQFFYEPDDQGDSGSVQRRQSRDVPDLVGDPRVVD
jgi:hypothetical protein